MLDYSLRSPPPDPATDLATDPFAPAITIYSLPPEIHLQIICELMIHHTPYALASLLSVSAIHYRLFVAYNGGTFASIKAPRKRVLSNTDQETWVCPAGRNGRVKKPFWAGRYQHNKNRRRWWRRWQKQWAKRKAWGIGFKSNVIRDDDMWKVTIRNGRGRPLQWWEESRLFPLMEEEDEIERYKLRKAREGSRDELYSSISYDLSQWRESHRLPNWRRESRKDPRRNAEFYLTGPGRPYFPDIGVDGLFFDDDEWAKRFTMPKNTSGLPERYH